MMMKRAVVALMVLLMAACSTTEQAKLSDVKVSGLLGDYSKLKPTNNPNQALLRYIDPTAPWSSYTKVRLEPVTFWAQSDSKIPLDVQAKLTDYAYAKLREAFIAKNVQLTEQDGPGVIVVRAALTDASAATPGLRTISVVVPQARLLNALSSLATGQYAFTGSIQTEGEIVDAVTGKRIAAWVDKRFGGAALENATTWEWGDAERAIDLWTSNIATRFVEVREGKMARSAM